MKCDCIDGSTEEINLLAVVYDNFTKFTWDTYVYSIMMYVDLITTSVPFSNKNNYSVGNMFLWLKAFTAQAWVI